MALKMKDTELAALVAAGVRNSSGHWDTKLSEERKTVTRYYDGLEPKQQHAGGSKFISQDVYDGVESMRAQLLETFGGSARPVTFAPQGAEDAPHAADATEYVNYALFRQNEGFGILRDVIGDGLLARNGIVKLWYDKDEEEVEETLTDVPYEQLLQVLTAKPDAELEDLELDPETQTVKSVKLVSKRDTSQVRIENVPPEEFGISKMSRSLGDAQMVFHRCLKTADALARMGVPEDKLKRLQSDDRLWATNSDETLERFNDVGEDDLDDRWNRDQDDAAREIETTEAYCRIDLDGRPKLWRIVVAGGQVLIKHVAKRLPYVVFTPLPRSHSFWGSNYAKKLIPTQNAKTLLTRGIIDHAMITNNPRTGVVKGGLVNPRELTEQRLGGIVNLNRADALVPIVQSGLNPFVFQTIGLLDDYKESNTGISKLSQGLNKDAVSKQNSGDMVSQLVGLSQVRQKVVARNFAEEFLKPLYLEIYRLIVENEKAEKIIEVAGSWTAVDPSAWPDRKDVVAEITVGFGERKAESEKWLAVDTYLAGDPRFAPVYTSDKRYYVIKKTLESMGIKDVNSIVADPSTVEPPGPDPMQEAEIAVKTAQAEAAKAQAQATVEKLKLEGERIRLAHEVAVAELQVRIMETQSKIAVQRAEVEAMQQAQAAGTLSAVASPDA